MVCGARSDRRHGRQQISLAWILVKYRQRRAPAGVNKASFIAVFFDWSVSAPEWEAGYGLGMNTRRLTVVYRGQIPEPSALAARRPIEDLMTEFPAQKHPALQAWRPEAG
jgi:hypothetical protein